MRPALQRLLSRPTSLDLLRILVGTPFAPASTGTAQASGASRKQKSRRYASAATDSKNISRHVPFVRVRLERPVVEDCTKPLEDRITLNKRKWLETDFSFDELDFESNVEGVLRIPRLVDNFRRAGDMQLWSCLLEYRKRIYGDAGVRMYWKAMTERGLILPTSIRNSGTNRSNRLTDFLFWETFLELGFKDHNVLGEICDYADKIRGTHEKQWVELYTSIVGHFLLGGDGEGAYEWHARLLPLHDPPRRQFGDMCSKVTLQGGDMEGLMRIVREMPNKNAYAKIIPKLIAQERFKDALRWHFFLVEHGNLPDTSKRVEPLIFHFGKYQPLVARKVTKSLVDAGVPFAANMSPTLVDNTKISREMINLAHGETFHITQKKYNDPLGARWLATSWVSLSVAITAVHALGMEQIGPLSLQAICLRELTAEAVVSRIDELKGLGISIGSSLFSRAVESFARKGNTEWLEGLVRSDQHPDELENRALQEKLLSKYAETKEWTQYRRTLEVLALAPKSPPKNDGRVEVHNLNIRSLITRRKMDDAIKYMERMEIGCVPITPTTISHFMRNFLNPRRRRKRPVGSGGQNPDIFECIGILKNLMRWSYVPPTLWREILKRLGMLSLFKDLEGLCLWLVEWYSCSSPHNRRPFRIPAELPTYHRLHPLGIIFSPALQSSIVEWGFIAELRRNIYNPRPGTRPRDLACGVRLVKQLNERGVFINNATVRKAIFNRLITYYGPGESKRLYNRSARKRIGSLHEVALQIDDALGGVYFTAEGSDLKRIVDRMAGYRWDGATKRMGSRVERQGKVQRLGNVVGHRLLPPRDRADT